MKSRMQRSNYLRVHAQRKSFEHEMLLYSRVIHYHQPLNLCPKLDENGLIRFSNMQNISAM